MTVLRPVDYSSKYKSFFSLACGYSGKSVGLVGYHASYLDHLILHLQYYLKIYCDALESSAQLTNKNVEELTFLDYGCGNGMLGIFAKHCGYKKVICCDLDAGSIEAAQRLSKAMQIQIDHFVQGDVESAEAFCSNNHLKPDLVIGTDVIEHIYDLDHFFSVMKKMNSGQVNIFTTASNPGNPFKVRQLRRLQYRDEITGGYRTHINMQEDCNIIEEPYLLLRKNIIKDFAPALIESEIEKLAHYTRGKNKADIEKSISEYQVSGTLPIINEHDANTCDPLTGSWTERILPLEVYKKVYADAGFKLKIRNGFYNDLTTSVPKRWILSGLNAFISFGGKPAGIIAPFIILSGAPLEKDLRK